MKSNTLFDAVANVSGNSFIGMDMVTTVKLKGGKGNPQQGRVQKRVTGAVMQVFQNKGVNGYEEMVKRRLIAEGKSADDFKLGERAWGERLANTPIIKHEKDGDTKYYLEGIFQNAGEVEYLLDGKTVSITEIEGMDAPKPSAQSQGGLNDKVVIRTIDATNIAELRINGTSYK